MNKEGNANLSKKETIIGDYIKERRTALNISMRSLAREVGCSPAYMNDIEKSNRQASAKYLDAIFKALQLPESERQFFDDMAAAARGSGYVDINPYLNRIPSARVALRTAIEKDFNDQDWLEIIESMNKQ